MARPGRRRQKYDQAWAELKKQQDLEDHNITILPKEAEYAKELAKSVDAYRKAADRFMDAPSAAAYFGDANQGGVHERFRDVRDAAERIRILNEDAMKKASADAQRSAVTWCLWLAGGLAVTALLAGLLAWTTLRAVLGPLRGLARTAEAVGAGNLNLIVAATDDEVGQAARAFNHMIRQLRDYRQSHSSRLLRAAHRPGRT